ncbi:MAG: Flp pilus assembly complex ATPase component TadA [Deltaproteobacteria bacterium]|nr:Flp pilus assembly complex ATPase component TadA [Deltaproteobacteria bacterium]
MKRTPDRNHKKLRYAERRKRIGELLADAGKIPKEAVGKALELQKEQYKSMGEILIDMGAADDIEVAKALAEQLEIPFVRLNDIEISDEIISLVPHSLAHKYSLIPREKTNKGLIVAMSNPLDLSALNDLSFVTRMPIHAAVAPERDIVEAIGRYYSKQDMEKDLEVLTDSEDGLEILQAEKEEEDLDNVQDLLDMTERPPIMKFTNAMLVNAINQKASDIHIEPQKTSVTIRYRIDGVMRNTMKVDKYIHAPLISRIKVISDMDISIRRKPQDGKTQVKYQGKVYDLRVSSIPTSYGEKITIRILNPDMAGIGFEDLGLTKKAYEELLEVISIPQGIMLITGPTGSGKSTTLYACLNKLNSPDVNIVTVEDPVEYDIQGINQVQINPKAGITFAEGLRSLLRQDPDIIMVGEIRDSETATIACQAAQTGHLVLSTLHTNDAPSAVVRLLDLGIEPFIIASSLVAVVGQRLVRRTCNKCRTPYAPDRNLFQRPPLDRIDMEKATFWRGKGCDACQQTGYKGRLGIFEVLKVTPTLREVITSGMSDVALKSAAEKEGFQPMIMDGIVKVMQGQTTIEEILRAVPPEMVKSHVQVPESSGKDQKVIQGRPEIDRKHVGVGKKKILVADDSVIMLKSLTRVLESRDYVTVSAENGIEALSLASKERPDLIITDLVMPKMDGITLVKELKKRDATKEIPVIMLTAQHEVDTEVAGLTAGADDYLTKPINARRLLVRVDRLLDK